MAELLSEDSTESDSEVVESSQETKCCVCKKSEPEDESEDFMFVGMLKWGKCDSLHHYLLLFALDTLKNVHRGQGIEKG